MPARRDHFLPVGDAWQLPVDRRKRRVDGSLAKSLWHKPSFRGKCPFASPTLRKYGPHGRTPHLRKKKVECPRTRGLILGQDCNVVWGVTKMSQEDEGGPEGHSHMSVDIKCLSIDPFFTLILHPTTPSVHTHWPPLFHFCIKFYIKIANFCAFRGNLRNLTILWQF